MICKVVPINQGWDTWDNPYEMDFPSIPRVGDEISIGENTVIGIGVFWTVVKVSWVFGGTANPPSNWKDGVEEDFSPGDFQHIQIELEYCKD